MPYIDTNYNWIDVNGLWSLDKWGQRNGGRYFSPKPFPNTEKALNKFMKDYKEAKRAYTDGLADLDDAQQVLAALESEYSEREMTQKRADLERQFVLAVNSARTALLKKAEPEIHRAVFMVIQFLFNNGGQKDETGTVTRQANIHEMEPICDALRGTDTERALFGMYSLLAIIEDLTTAADPKALNETYNALNTTGREAMDNMALFLTGGQLLAHNCYTEKAVNEGELDEL